MPNNVRPTGLRTINIAAEPVATESKNVVLCDLSRGAYNSAQRGKLAYSALTFVMVLFVAGCTIYAVTAFSDEKSAAGFIALVGTVGTLITTGVLGVAGKSASTDSDEMWKRVEKYCKGS